MLEGKSYDTIVANINRNILLADLGAYNKSLKTGGELFLSGFYENDIPAIKRECEKRVLGFQE